MLQVARLAPRTLGDAAERLRAFFEQHLNEDGGANDRSGKSDLYYTVFVLEGLLALQAEIPVARVVRYLDTFADGAELDLVHLGCLARCWAALPKRSLTRPRAQAIAEHVARYRSADGGFAPDVGRARGTVYHSFLSLGATQDLGVACENQAALATCVASLRAADGGYANQDDLPVGSTPVTAAAITLLRYLSAEVPPDAVTWLLALAQADGGFKAVPEAPMPDLLSTATALHALSGMHVDLEPLRDPTLDFIDTLWTGQAFCAHWADDEPDVEYAYYALLALGHLSL